MKKIVFVLFVAFLISFYVFIQEGLMASDHGAIRGIVTDSYYPEAHILEGVIVTVENKTLLACEGGKRSVKTDSKGEYLIDNLPEGEYIVTASKPGYSYFTDERITVSAGAEVFHDIRMWLKTDQTPIGEYVVGVEKAPVPKPRRPQEPQKPYPYKEEEVVYENKKAGVKLAGTLTFPDSKGPFPAVILLSDYEPHNRDELLPGLGHRPFLVLADYLTRQDIAVLRTDDRGVDWSTGQFFLSTLEDLADDALAGVEYLKSRKEINAGQIGFIGRGVGGSVALIAATQSQDAAFIVLMAGMGLTGEELVLLRILNSRDESDEDIARKHELFKRIFAMLRQEKDNKIAQQKLCDIIADVTVEFSESKLSEEDIQAIRTSSGASYSGMLTPYHRSFLIYDPRPDVMKIKCPVLAINGEKNMEIPPKENLNAIEEALKAGGNKHYTVKELPGLNFLFQTLTEAVPEHEIEETISPTALKIIGDWILEQTASKK